MVLAELRRGVLAAVHARDERPARVVVLLVEKPRTPERAEVRFLDEAELEALLRAVPRDSWGGVERVLYLAAGLTGLRTGKLLGLRWMDVDWTARRVRVRQAWVRGEYTTPKSARGSRSVPLAARVAAALDELSRRTLYSGDADLVFAHPHLGTPLAHSKLRKRFKAALVAAGVREVRFHDFRHTFGTRVAAAGVAIRTLREWLEHRDLATTQIYADYQPSGREAELVDAAFRGVDTLDGPPPACRVETRALLARRSAAVASGDGPYPGVAPLSRARESGSR